MKLNPAIANILAPAYMPCASFQGACSRMRWQPEVGHVPRGFLGASGKLDEVELVLVFAEPGDPPARETHHGMESAYDYAGLAFSTGMDLFHRNVRKILDSCWPDLTFEQQMCKAWLTESVLCSAQKECASVPVAVTRACGRRYLAAQLELFPSALVVALGGKAKMRLLSLGYTTFLAAAAVAPPGCNRREAKESWELIPQELKRRQKART